MSKFGLILNFHGLQFRNEATHVTTSTNCGRIDELYPRLDPRLSSNHDSDSLPTSPLILQGGRLKKCANLLNDQ